MNIEIGRAKSEKIKRIQKIVKDTKKKKVIFDFNNHFHGGKTIYLDEFHPLVGELNLAEVKAINAAYLSQSRTLAKRAEEIYIERKRERLPNVVQEAIERMYSSFDDKWGEAEWAKRLSERIGKIKPNQKCVDEIIKKIEKEEIVVIKFKNLHSYHLRALMYLILHKLSLIGLDLKIIIDESTTLFFKGNIKFLSEITDFHALDIVLFCNKPAKMPVIDPKGISIVNVVSTEKKKPVLGVEFQTTICK